MSFPRRALDAPFIKIATSPSLETRLESITILHRVGHSEGEEAGYNGEDGESHVSRYVFYSDHANVSVDHEDEQERGVLVLTSC